MNGLFAIQGRELDLTKTRVHFPGYSSYLKNEIVVVSVILFN